MNEHVSSLKETLEKHGFTTCEALKHAFRQTKNGNVVSFVMHLNDFDAGIATAKLGTRVLLALIEIKDDETTSPHRSEAGRLPSTVADGDTADRREAAPYDPSFEDAP